MPLRNHHHHHCHISYLTLTFRRCFATKYSGRVVNEADNGRSFAVEVESPALQTDIRGYVLPRRELICKISQILHSPKSATSDPFLDLTEYLQTLAITPTPSEVSEILKTIRSPSKALSFFRFCASSIPNYCHDFFTYNRILLIMSKASSFSDSHRLDVVRSVVDEMSRLGVKGSISTVNILIGIFEGTELERCLDLVKKWDLRLNCYTYKCLLQAYLRSNCSNEAFEVYVEMRKRGYKLDIFAYNMLLDSLDKYGKVAFYHAF